MKPKIMKRILVTFSALLALVACNKEAISDELVFDIDIHATKATANVFEVGDEVALFAVEYLDKAAPELQIAGNFINNEKLIYYGNEWKSQRKLYWSSKPCDFYALYPYQELSSVENHHFEIVSDQNNTDPCAFLGGYEASDLLWAKATNVTREDGKVTLQFKHLMSKCVVTLSKGETFEGEIPSDVVAHIYNTNTSVNINFAEGSVAKSSQETKKTITMKKISNTRFEAIVVPQNIERRTPLIEVTLGGIAYLLEYNISFKPGYSHTINLILNTSPDQEKIDISIDPEIDGMD